MKKGRLTKQEQSLRFKLLLEYVFIFRYATRAQLDLFAQTAIKLRFPQRLIEYALSKGYLGRYYEPKFKAKIYFLTKKGEDFLYDDQPLIEHYSFEKGNIGENSFLEHNLLIDTYFLLNRYIEVGLKKWQSEWLLRRLSKQRVGTIPDALFVTADSKKIAVETLIEHKGLASLKHTVTFYQSEIEKNYKYHAVLVVASCSNQYEYLKKYLLAINPIFCSKAFILTELGMLEQSGCCLYQNKLMVRKPCL
jgi:hypothetical protein